MPEVVVDAIAYTEAQAATRAGAVPATILHLPMVYGPGDPQHRERGALDTRRLRTELGWPKPIAHREARSATRPRSFRARRSYCRRRAR